MHIPPSSSTRVRNGHTSQRWQGTLLDELRHAERIKRPAEA
jgi:hypothetical protein